MYTFISPGVTGETLAVIFLQSAHCADYDNNGGQRFGDNVQMLNLYNCHRYTLGKRAFRHTHDITIYDNVMHL